MLDRMARAFDELAGDYDDGHHDAVAAALVEFVAPAPGDAVADVACGTGAVALAVARSRPAGAAPVLAVDVSPGMVAAGRARAARSGAPPERSRSRSLGEASTVSDATGAIDWRVAPAVPLPVGDASLDVILCSSSLHFLGTAALADWRRALRPGGRAGFTLPLAADFRAGGVFATLVAGDLPLPATADDARALAEAAGFAGVRTRTVTAGTRRVVLVAGARPVPD